MAATLALTTTHRVEGRTTLHAFSHVSVAFDQFLLGLYIVQLSAKQVLHIVKLSAQQVPHIVQLSAQEVMHIVQLSKNFLAFAVLKSKSKSETQLTASVLKQDTNIEKVKTGQHKPIVYVSSVFSLLSFPVCV